MPIKKIIFDMGNVLLPLNKQKMFLAFAKLSGQDEKQVAEVIATEEAQRVWDGFDHNMSPTNFRINIRKLLNIKTSVDDSKIDAAWNALLDPIPKATIDFLKKLKASNKYQVILLSNSNPIHYGEISKLYERDFSDCFHQQWYSHHINKAKPDASAYLAALDGSDPAEAIFFDDKIKNILAARKLGIHSVEVPVGMDITTMVDSSIAEIEKAELLVCQQTASWVRLGLFGAFAVAAVAVSTMVYGSSPNVVVKK